MALSCKSGGVCFNKLLPMKWNSLMKIQLNKAIYLLSLLFVSQASLALDWSETNKAITDEFAIPRFEQLLDSSKQLMTQTETFCQKGGEEEFEKTREKFHKMMDAWQGIQILRTGPAELLMRNFRIEMWPDRSNTGAKQIRKLLADKNPDALKPEVFSRSSTAVQGLSAIERIMFAKDIQASEFQAGGKANYRCQLLQAITVNLNTISTNLLKDWQTTYKETITVQSEKNEVFASHKEVASAFLKEATTQLQAIYDQKFKRPFDDKRFRPKRAESWRSGRSLRNITLNLESVQALFETGFNPHLKDEALKKKLDAEFKQAIKTGKTFTMPLLKAHEEKTEALKKWMDEVSQLKRTVTVDVPKALDISLGFNSLDGD